MSDKTARSRPARQAPDTVRAQKGMLDMGKQPIIGVAPLLDRARGRWWMVSEYLDRLAGAGALPVVLPMTERPDTAEGLADRLDGLLLPGGHDISPDLYGEELLPACGELSPQRDGLEARLFALALERGKPVLGICRGLQLINVLLGGSLYQDLPTQYPSELLHRQEKPYAAPCHGAALERGTPLQALLGTDAIQVNSLHHQAVRTLSPRLEAMAYAPDGLVEAAWMPEAPFVWGVQWHPELMPPEDAPSRALFRRFVQAAGG